MAVQRFEGILVSYGSLISNEHDIHKVKLYFNELHFRYAEANCAEILDMRKNTIERNPSKIRALIKSGNSTPFLFICGLN